MRIKLIFACFCFVYQVEAQNVLEISRIDQKKKSIFITKDDLIAIQLKSEPERKIYSGNCHVEKLQSDTLHVISYSYNFEKKVSTKVEEAIPLSQIDKIYFSPRECQGSILIFVGPLLILMSPFIAIDLSDDGFNERIFFIAFGAGCAATTISYLKFRACSIKTYDLEEEWVLKPVVE